MSLGNVFAKRNAAIRVPSWSCNKISLIDVIMMCFNEMPAIKEESLGHHLLNLGFKNIFFLNKERYV